MADWIGVDMANHMHGTRCTVERRGGEFCDAPTAEDMPFPICGRHAAKLYRHIVRAMGGLVDDRVFMLNAAAADIQAQQAKEVSRSTERDKVYYVQVGEYIKIGYTSQLKTRMTSYPPNKKLLATEPGDKTLERKRHEQFGHLLEHGHEWFRVDAKLIAHINELRRMAGGTAIAWSKSA